MSTSTVYLYLNGNLVETVNQNNSIFPYLTNVTYIFETNKTSNIFCVGSAQTWKTGTFDSGSATLVDNFVLQIIPKNYINVLFESFLPVNTNILYLNSSTYINASFLAYLQQNSIITVNNIPEIQFLFSIDVNGFLLLTINMSNWTNITSVTCLTNNFTIVNNQIYFFSYNFHYKYQIQILFNVQYNQNTNIIVLNSSSSYSQPFSSFIITNSQFNLPNAQLQNDSNGYIWTNISSKIFPLTLSCVLNENLISLNKIYNFTVNFSYFPIIRSNISQNLPIVQRSENFKNRLEKISSKSFQGFFRFYLLLRTVGCSYFLINFISFYNLIILYNFLNLNTQPYFSHKILLQLSKIFLENDNDLFNLLQRMAASVNINFVIDFSIFVNNEEPYEKIPKIVQNDIWFGSMEITYNFFENNFIDLFILGLLLFKFLIIYVIKIVIPQNISRFFPNRKKFAEIFVVQFLCSSPVILIASLETIIVPGNQYFLQKINIFLHYLFFGLILFLPFLYYLSVYYPLFRKSKKQQKNLSYKRRQQIFLNNIFNSLQYGLHVFIPCLIILKNKTNFFVCTSLYYILMFFAFMKGFSLFSTFKKLAYGIVLLTFIIHHISFLFLYILFTKNKQIQNIWIQSCNFVGTLVIFTVFIGAIAQILIEISNIFYKIVKQIINQCKSKDDPTQRQNRSRILSRLKRRQKYLTNQYQIGDEQIKCIARHKKIQTDHTKLTKNKQMTIIRFIPVMKINQTIIPNREHQNEQTHQYSL